MQSHELRIHQAGKKGLAGFEISVLFHQNIGERIPVDEVLGDLGFEVSRLALALLRSSATRVTRFGFSDLRVSERRVLYMNLLTLVPNRTTRWMPTKLSIATMKMSVIDC